MIKETFKDIDVDVYYEELENGLRVYLAPFKNRKNYRINYFTRYGAEINEFVPHGEKKKIKVPYGVAHFLEHKVFEQETGEDPFSFFAKSGCDANASTGYKTTSYTVNGSKNIEENLEFLLNYVNSPYFTDKNVEKEKGIIIQEINMYKDEPEGKLFDHSNKAIFQKHPCRIDIGGTEKSVRSITKETLYQCYNTFYQPSNMYLVITGGFDVDKVMEVVRNNEKLNSKESKKPIKRKRVNEPESVRKSKEVLNIANLSKPKMVLTYKSKVDRSDEKESMKQSIALEILLHHYFGSSSTFREEMLNNNLMTFMYTSKDFVDDILLVEIVAESDNVEKLSEETMKRMKNFDITKEDVERIKKVMIANHVYGSDKPGSVMGMIISGLVAFNKPVYNAIDIIKELTIEDIKKANNVIGFNNYTLIIGKPKE